MNYFNPYYFSYPVMQNTIRPSLFKGLLSKVNFSNILSGTSKTLNVVNQAIPIVKQAGPIFKNAKTMFKVMNEFKKSDSKEENEKNDLNETKKVEHKDIGPTFFL